MTTTVGVAAAYAIGPRLPGIYQDDELVQTVCSAIDEVLAPVVSTIDSFAAYLDPGTTPEDFVWWLASWVGLDMAPAYAPPDVRQAVRDAVRRHSARGTPALLAATIEAWCGVPPQIEESGGMGWSPEPDAPLPGDAQTRLVVTLRVEHEEDVDADGLDALVRSVKPAHVPHEIRVVVAAGSG